MTTIGEAALPPATARATPPADHGLPLQRAAVRDGSLTFDAAAGLPRALRDGCFLLEIPAHLDLGPGVALSREFYRALDDGDPSLRAYRGFREQPGVYFDREHFQTEHVLLDRPSRARLFPPPLIAMCDHLNDLALLVLRRVLAESALAPELWSRATGGAVENLGTHWFASSHYRPERDLLGCAPHKDTGFVTILYLEQDGLECSVDGQWRSIDPVPGHFVVNFGGALEILMQHTRTPVKAILHRVRKTARRPGLEDRFSFAAFANPPSTGTLYQADAEGGARPYQRVEEFLVDFNKTTWNDRHDDFGIK